MKQVTKEQELLMNLLAMFTQDKMLTLMVMSAFKIEQLKMIDWLMTFYQNKLEITSQQIIDKLEQIVSKMN